MGNAQGEFLYVSTILREYKVRSAVLSECLHKHDAHYAVCEDEAAAMSAEHIIEEIHEFVGEDVRDSVIETRFGDRMVCLAAHPYFSMCAKESESAASTGMDTPTGR